MSFRSRSTKPVAPPRRRSSSLTRTAGTANNYQSTPNGRPFSVHGSTLSSFPSSQSNYYGSNQNLRMAGSDYYGNASSTDYRRPSYGQSSSSMKFPSGATSYTSPYKDRYTQNYGSGANTASGYTSAYKDRGYYNPYTSSSYDNGVTTASLSIPGSSMKRDYVPGRSNGLGGSSTNLMGNGQSINDKVANIGRSQSLREHERKSRSRKCAEAVKAAVPDTAGPYDGSSLGSTLSSANKSLSSLSLHSEGYEVIRWHSTLCLQIFFSIRDWHVLTTFLLFGISQSGNESRSRAESLASNALGDANDDGEFLDYKALYEAAK